MAWSNLKSNWVNGDQYTPTNQNDVASAINVLANGATTAFVTTSETTTSTTYADLTTTTDTVTVTIGSTGKALVVVSGLLQNTTAGGYAYIGYAVSGASTVAANDNMAIAIQTAASNGYATAQHGGTFLVTGLTAGSTTFKMKYRVSTGTGTFQYRRIAVIPFP
jgi:hypothetical protein